MASEHIIEVKHRLITGAPFTLYGAFNRCTQKTFALSEVLESYRRQIAEKSPLAAVQFKLVRGPVEICIPLREQGRELNIDNFVHAVLALGRQNMFCGTGVSELRQEFGTYNGIVRGIMRAGVDYTADDGCCFEVRMAVLPPFIPGSYMYKRLENAARIFPSSEENLVKFLASQP